MTEKKENKEISGLDLMRKEFGPNHISKLPKQAKWMTEKKDEYKNCSECGGFHHPKAVHLDYVGHAALTDRLLDCDKSWHWEPLAFDQNGLPALDKNGGMWIKLTVCGVTRLGYGHPDGKTGGDAVKEIIGDALRNAAMRFGAALDLWHKGILHVDEDAPKQEEAKAEEKPKNEAKAVKELCARIKKQILECTTPETVNYVWGGFKADLDMIKQKAPTWFDALDAEYGKKLANVSQAPVSDDQIPY